MTEPVEHVPAESSEGVQEVVVAIDGPDVPLDPAEPLEGQGTTFPLAYVQQLRQENAEARVRAKRADALATRLILSIAEGTGQLIDPSDLAVSAEVLPEFLGDDGLPDITKVHDAVARLIAAKPHLAKPVYAADVGQGVQHRADVGPGLGAMLRQAAG